MNGLEALADTWDLVVVGCGPAGAAAALAALSARPGMRVLMIDRADFPRDKCCGDGVAPHVFDVLRGLGADGVADGWTPLLELELTTGRESVTGRLRRPVWVIPRAVFDARLVECAVTAGAVLVRHRVADVVQQSHGVVVDSRLSGRVLVAADGANSVVRGALGLGPTARRAFALRGYAPTHPGRRARQVIRYGDRRQPSYAWAFDRGDGLSNVGYGELVGGDPERAAEPPTRALLLEQLERLLPGATEHGEQWRGHHLPLSGWRWHQPEGRVLLTGDAAGLVNPMTGEGIYYAVATGAIAGRVAADVTRSRPATGAGGAHRREVRRLLGRHLRHTSAAGRLSSRSSFVDAGIRAASRSSVVFDDLVELGLGGGLISPRVVRGLVTDSVHRVGRASASHGRSA